MKLSWVLIIGIIAVSFVSGIYFYPRMPPLMASHWNMQGNPDSYTPKALGVFSIPLISLALLGVFALILKIDPLRKNIGKFRKYYDGFMIIFFTFLLFVQAYVIAWNLGSKISPNIVFPVLTGILLFCIGVLCEKSKRNWFIGIRTPWTLSSDKVWGKTHKIGGMLFKAASIIALLGIFFRQYAMLFVIVPVIGITVYTVVYSYFEYKKISRL